LLVGDVVGGFIARAAGAETWDEAWGFDTQHTVPLPVAAAQLVLAWLGVVLLCLTAAVGLLATVRARQLRARR
jgi:hypothetical protein